MPVLLDSGTIFLGLGCASSHPFCFESLCKLRMYYVILFSLRHWTPPTAWDVTLDLSLQLPFSVRQHSFSCIRCCGSSLFLLFPLFPLEGIILAMLANLQCSQQCLTYIRTQCNHSVSCTFVVCVWTILGKKHISDVTIKLTVISLVLNRYIHCRDFSIAPVGMNWWEVLFLTISLGEKLSLPSWGRQEHLVKALAGQVSYQMKLSRREPFTIWGTYFVSESVVSHVTETHI